MDFKNWVRKAIRNGCQFENIKAIRSLKDVQFNINERAKYSRIIKNKIVGGKVGLITSGMDCDCAAFEYASVVDATSIARIVARIHEAYDNAEGPLNFRFVTPNEAKQYQGYSRDLALEAFEEGHPHVVYY